MPLHLHRKKIILAILFIGIIGVFLITNLASAQTKTAEEWDYMISSLQAESGNVQTQEATNKEVGGLVYLAARIAAWVFQVSAYILNYVINLSNLDSIVNLPAVKLGWSIILNVANLGFVLAIIVIAFATILRRETYAMKNTLAKLIVAALLVNFSLVIAGAFISVSDTVSNVFLDKMTTIKNKDFALRLASVFNPQRLLEVKDTGWLDKIFKAGQALLAFLVSLLFVVVFTGLMIISFMSLSIMLLIRYVALAILLILSPIIWVTWIFPMTKHLWDSWWKQFIRWVFFAPAILFFVYLTVNALPRDVKCDEGEAGCINGNKVAVTSEAQENIPSDLTAVVTGETVGTSTQITPTVKIKGEGLTDMIANGLIILGLLFGGLIVANKMSIVGGDLGVKWAKGAGKKFGAWSGRMALRGGTGLLRGGVDAEGKTRAQRWVEKATTGGWLKRQTLGRLAGRAAQLSDVGIRSQAAGLEKQYAKMSVSQLQAAAATTLDPLRRTMAELALSGKKIFNENNLLTKDAKERFSKYGKGREYEDMETVMGGNWGIHAAAKEAAAAEKSGDADRWVAAQEKLEKLQNEFTGKIGKEGISKIDFKKKFGSKPAFGNDPDVHRIEGEALANSLMFVRPEAIGMAAGRVAGNDIPELSRMMRTAFKRAFGGIQNKAIVNRDGLFDAGGIKALRGLRLIEGRELDALKELKEILKTKDPRLHFEADRIGRGLRSMAHSVFEPFARVAGGRRAPKEEEEEEEE